MHRAAAGSAGGRRRARRDAGRRRRVALVRARRVPGHRRHARPRDRQPRAPQGRRLRRRPVRARPASRRRASPATCSRSPSGRARSSRRNRAWRWCAAARRRRWCSATRPPSACASTPAPQVEAPLVFAGHGLVIPELNHDDFAGPRHQGQGGRAPVGQPEATCPARSARTISRPPSAGAPSSGCGAHRHDHHPQPQEHGRAVGALGAQPAEPVDGAGRRQHRRHRRRAGVDRVQPGEGREAVRGLGAHAGRGARRSPTRARRCRISRCRPR